MKFADSNSSYFFVIAAGLFALYFYAYKKKQVLLKRFSSANLLNALTDSSAAGRQNFKNGLILTIIILAVLSLMRPQWGFRWEEVKQRGADIFIAVDVSKSMLTEDVLPSRLLRAKLALEDLVKNLRGDRVGIIAFAGNAFVQCPLTVDYDGFFLAAEDLNAGLIPKGGTNIESVINEAIKSFTAGSEGANRALIIISDGESHEGEPVRAAERAAGENIKIFTVGVGTKEGELISIADEQGTRVYVKDKQGQVIKSRLNEELLQEIALKTGGSYLKATATQFGLDTIYENKIARTQEKRDATTNMEKRYEERFQSPLLLALILLFIEPFLGERRKNK